MVLTGFLQRKNQEAFQGQEELKPWKAEQILDCDLSLVIRPGTELRVCTRTCTTMLSASSKYYLMRVAILSLFFVHVWWYTQSFLASPLNVTKFIACMIKCHEKLSDVCNMNGHIHIHKLAMLYDKLLFSRLYLWWYVIFLSFLFIFFEFTVICIKKTCRKISGTSRYRKDVYIILNVFSSLHCIPLVWIICFHIPKNHNS